MNPSICNHCRKAFRLKTKARPLRKSPSRRSSTSNATPSNLTTLLSKPTWSVRSLLPSTNNTTAETDSTTVTPKTLHHLLRLSALPPPASADEESRMLSTLESQLGFVRAVRDVDTTNVEPLRAIRDETAQGLREQTVGLEQLKEALAEEDVVGHSRRPRRRRRGDGAGTGNKGEKEKSIDPEVEGWDVLAGASETVGRYFVVRTASPTSSQSNSSQTKDTTKI